MATVTRRPLLRSRCHGSKKAVLLVFVTILLTIIMVRRYWWMTAQTRSSTSSLVRHHSNSAASAPSIAIVSKWDRQAPLNSAHYPACSIFEQMVKDGIQLVALDFDQTVIDMHTGGRWRGTAAELVPHVRPDLVCLVTRCLDHDGPMMAVAIATFSTQKELLQNVLQLAIPHDKVKDIPVFGGADVVHGLDYGKASQLFLARQQLGRGDANKIAVAATMLIDDDRHNIKAARQDGYQTLLYPVEDHF